MNISEQTDVREVARRLGYDLYRFRRELDRTALPPAIDEGWILAAARQVPKEPGDRVVNKWLQLRLNALKRDRVVDERVTTQYLKRIDVRSCPVTRVALTHGERIDSDWSVDRLNNDGGYAPHNLAVMSTRANQAKGGRSFDEVFALSRLDRRTDDLAAHEWLRMASLMLGACFAPHAGQAPLPRALRRCHAPRAETRDALLGRVARAGSDGGLRGLEGRDGFALVGHRRRDRGSHRAQRLRRSAATAIMAAGRSRLHALIPTRAPSARTVHPIGSASRIVTQNPRIV